MSTYLYLLCLGSQDKHLLIVAPAAAASVIPQDNPDKGRDDPHWKSSAAAAIPSFEKNTFVQDFVQMQ